MNTSNKIPSRGPSLEKITDRAKTDESQNIFKVLYFAKNRSNSVPFGISTKTCKHRSDYFTSPKRCLPRKRKTIVLKTTQLLLSPPLSESENPDWFPPLLPPPRSSGKHAVVHRWGRTEDRIFFAACTLCGTEAI